MTSYPFKSLKKHNVEMIIQKSYLLTILDIAVGNIPYEATEEHLREIFGQAGPVLSFRLVYDRESGKPKGYGFCEYKDLETAQSAMRNLNGVELHGRNLRVDSAASEKNKEENRG